MGSVLEWMLGRVGEGVGQRDAWGRVLVAWWGTSVMIPAG
jgi:hypothetical protein